MIPGRGAIHRGVGVATRAAQIVHQVLAIDDEAHLVGQPRVLERVPGQLAVLLVVVGHQDRDRSGAQLRLNDGMRLSAAPRRSRAAPSSVASPRADRSGSDHGESRADARLAFGDHACRRDARRSCGTARARSRFPGTRVRPCRRSNTRKMRCRYSGSKPIPLSLTVSWTSVAGRCSIRSDLRGGARATELDRVGDQVLHQLAHLQRVGVDRGQLADVHARPGSLYLGLEIVEDLAGDLARSTGGERTPVRRHAGELQ